MKNVVWLASYPKSGNTWLRVFIANLLQNSTSPLDINQLWKMIPIASSRKVFDEILGIDSSLLSFEEIDCLRPEVYQAISQKSKKTVFLKIHDAYGFSDCGEPYIPEHITKAVVYIIRNPLDVAVSLANHSGISIDQAIHSMEDESNSLSSDPTRYHSRLRQKLSTWSNHVRSWTETTGLNLHVVRYEDMKLAPLDIFTRLVEFLQLGKDMTQIQRALDFSAFKELQNQEARGGYIEKPQSCHSFFYYGRVGRWREILTRPQVQRIIEAHQEIMETYGYTEDLVFNPTARSEGIARG